MIDVFNEEIEVQIKLGISNLYWYRGDLKKAWLRVRVDKSLAEKIFNLKNEDGSKISKRQRVIVNSCG